MGLFMRQKQTLKQQRNITKIIYIYWVYMTFFQTKTRPEDFVVTEILDEEPSGKGDYHYILLEKKGLTTFLLIDLMVKDLGLNRNMIWIAWLKDKHAVTRQWISILKRDVAKYVGGINDLLAWMRKKGKIVKATYGDKMLKLWNNAWNHFAILLVAKKTLTQEQKDKIQNYLVTIDKKWLPNYFGDQRFGHGWNNWKIWYELLAGKIRNIPGDKNTLAEKRFKVQAFASYVFNRYVDERINRGLLYEVLPWDIKSRGDEIVTWPMPGDDLKMATGKAGDLEKEVFKKVWLEESVMKRFASFSLFGIRRPIILYPKNMKFSWRKEGLFLSFDLPSWAYATVVIDEIEKLLSWWKSPKTFVDSKKIIEEKKLDIKPAKRKKVVAPGINPYTGQKINTDKAKNRARRAEKKSSEKSKDG